MGCTQSKIENEESVARCKERKQFMRSAVAARNAFAAAHSAYSMSLKNTGAALSDYIQGEVEEHRLTSSSAVAAASAAQAPSSSSSAAGGSSASAVQPPVDNLPPPPPPLPADLPPAAPLHRSASMPGLPISKVRRNKSSHDSAIIEEDGLEGFEVDVVDGGPAAPEEPLAPPPAPPKPPKPSESQPPLPPPQSASQENSWDYFNLFSTEHIPAPSLGQPEEVVPDKEVEKFAKVVDSLPAVAVNDPQPLAPAAKMPEKDIAEPPPPALQQKPVRKPRQSNAHHRSASSGGGSDSKRGKLVAAVAQSVSFLQILKELDDHFLKASESAHEVSKMLEATRMHYHSNFADNRGHIDHSEKVMKVITWNRSIKGIRCEDDGKDDFDDEKWETHATVLDKMLAWEKKLYDEVKAVELMKIEYQRKISLLNKQKKRDAGPESLEKIKAAVNHLHTRYIVDMQSMDSTVSEINDLRDHKLYPRLVELVTGMATMWEAMHLHHSNQYKLAAALRASEVSLAPRETSEQHHDTTIQLWQIVREWHSQFQNLVTHQKEYIQALNSWLRLNLVSIESSLKEKVSSPPSSVKPPIRDLLLAWRDQLEKLPDGLAKGAIFSFSEVFNTIVILQEDELKLKERCEETHKEFIRKKRSFEDWHLKYMKRKNAALSQETDEGRREAANERDLVEERRLAVESLEIRLKSEEETYQRTCRQVRDKSVGSLRNHLPELFRAMSSFSLACSEMYMQLRSITESGTPVTAD